MKKIYYAITAGAVACAFLAIPLAQADDQKDKLAKAKRLEEQIRQPEAPVASTTTKTAPTEMHRSEFEPPKKPLKIKEPPSPVVTTPKAPVTTSTTTTTTTTPKAPVTTSTTTTTAPSTSVSTSTSTAKTTTPDKPKKSEPEKK